MQNTKKLPNYCSFLIGVCVSIETAQHSLEPHLVTVPQYQYQRAPVWNTNPGLLVWADSICFRRQWLTCPACSDKLTLCLLEEYVNTPSPAQKHTVRRLSSSRPATRRMLTAEGGEAVITGRPWTGRSMLYGKRGTITCPPISRPISYPKALQHDGVAEESGV